LLAEPLVEGDTIDAKVLYLLQAEYVRRLGHYRRVDMGLNQKYGMTFDQFVAQRAVRQSGYSWEVESDAMEWETAISGMQTFQRKLKELQLAEE
jgi:hypothetical protein